MKKIVYIVLLLSLLSVSAVAQRISDGVSSRWWTIGAGMRVGFGSMMQKADVESDRTKGFDGAVDGVFNYYFHHRNTKLPFFGVRTGLSVGYKQNSISMPIDLTYKTVDSEGRSITYHVLADNVKETDRQMSLELPVMFAAWYKNIFANLGLRVGIPAVSRYEQKMGNHSVTATFDDYDVSLTDELVTGKISLDDTRMKAKLDAAGFNLCLALEGGYEFDFLGNRLSAGIYVDYGLVDNYKGNGAHFADADPSVIDPSTNTPASVVVNTLTDSYVSSVGIFDIGVRAVYSWRHPRKSASKSKGNSHGAKGRPWRPLM
ncbi:MAG: PorT family protein [Bacteroidales bacterium]|nr:PorT family protein [Bacteroidales bacterium]